MLAALTVATMWTVTAEMLPSGLLPVMSRDLDVDEASIGALVSVWAITIAVVGIPLVRLTARFPRRTVLVASLAATSLTGLLTAFAPTFPFVASGRILSAAAHGLFWSLLVAFIASAVPPERLGGALALVLAGPSIAGLLGLPAAAALANVVGWRPVAAALALLLAATTVWIWLVLPRVAASDAVPARSASAPAVGGVVLLGVAGALVLIGHYAVFTYVTVLATGHGDLDAAAVPALLLVSGVAGTAGVGISGVVLTRWPRAGLAASAVLATIGVAVVATAAGDPAAFTVGVAVWGFAIGLFPPLLQARGLRVASPPARSLAGSIIITVFNLGIAGGAAIGGVLYGLGPTSLLIGATVAMGVGAAGLACTAALPTRSD